MCVLGVVSSVRLAVSRSLGDGRLCEVHGIIEAQRLGQGQGQDRPRGLVGLRGNSRIHHRLYRSHAQ